MSDAPSHEVKAHRIPPIPTPHWGAQSGPAFTVQATVAVQASPPTVLDILLDTQTWPRWNNFVPRATLKDSHDSRLHPGIIFTEHVDMRGRGMNTIVKMKLLMTTLDDMARSGQRGYKVVWLGKGYPDWALRSERVHEIYEDINGGTTVYNVFETFSGPLAWVLKILMAGTLVRRFSQWNRELKAYVEQVPVGQETPTT